MATVVSLLLVDRMGRRRTLLSGALVMALSLVCLAVFAFIQQENRHESSHGCQEDAQQDSRGWRNASWIEKEEDCDDVVSSASAASGASVLRYVALASLMSYVAAYSFSFGPVTWLLLSEIFPPTVKGRAMSVSTSLNWAANWMISATFLRTVRLLSLAGVFLCYAVLTLVSMAFIYLAVPETCNKSLHRIAKELQSTTFAGRMAQHARQLPCLRQSTWLRLTIGGNYSQLANRSQQEVVTMETFVS